MLHPAKTETGLDIGMHGSAAAAVSLVCAMQLRTSITFMQLQLLSQIFAIVPRGFSTSVTSKFQCMK